MHTPADLVTKMRVYTCNVTFQPIPLAHRTPFFTHSSCIAQKTGDKFERGTRYCSNCPAQPWINPQTNLSAHTYSATCAANWWGGAPLLWRRCRYIPWMRCWIFPKPLTHSLKVDVIVANGVELYSRIQWGPACNCAIYLPARADLAELIPDYLGKNVRNFAWD